MSAFQIANQNTPRLEALGLSADALAGQAEAAITAAMAYNAQTRGVEFSYRNRTFACSRHQSKWSIELPDDLGGRQHLLDLARAPTSYGRAKSAGLFITPSFVKRN